MNNSNSKIWIFGGWSGFRYSDNSRYLFEYAAKQNGNRCIWLTRSKTVQALITSYGFEVYSFYSLQSLLLCLRADFLVICVSYIDLPFWAYLFPRKKKIINLWHGTPLKRLDFKRSFINRTLRKLLLIFLGREADMIISSSDLVTDTALTDYFDIARNKFLVTGYPRNDGLITDEYYSKNKDSQRYILFAPTFREYDKNVDLFEYYGFDYLKIYSQLESTNSILFIKLHPRDAHKSKKLMSTFGLGNRIRLLTDSDIKYDIYSFLGSVDILITDYSSIYFDFLLLNRPVIFSAFDIQEYENIDRGFYFNYDQTTPGLRAQSWDDIVNELQSLHEGHDKYKDERSRVNKLMNTYTDAENSKRTYEGILELQ